MVSRKAGKQKKLPASSQPHRPSGSVGDEPARPGWPAVLPTRLKWMDAQIEQRAFSRAEVVTYWTKAVGKAHDAYIEGLSTDTALESAYSAGRLAALSVLASRHIRIRAKSGHHEFTFSAVAALELKGCSELVVDSEEIRLARHDADYRAQLASEADAQQARRWMTRTLPLLRAALLEGDPELMPHLPAFERARQDNIP